MSKLGRVALLEDSWQGKVGGIWQVERSGCSRRECSECGIRQVQTSETSRELRGSLGAERRKRERRLAESRLSGSSEQGKRCLWRPKGCTLFEEGKDNPPSQQLVCTAAIVSFGVFLRERSLGCLGVEGFPRGLQPAESHT